MGVRGITLHQDDYVLGMETFAPTFTPPQDKRRKYFRDLLIVTSHGIGKRTPLEEYPTQKRGGQGVKVATLNNKTGDIAGAMMVTQTAEYLIITTKEAQAIKLPIKNIPQLKRPTQGVILMRPKSGDAVAATTIIDQTTTE